MSNCTKLVWTICLEPCSKCGSATFKSGVGKSHLQCERGHRKCISDDGNVNYTCDCMLFSSNDMSPFRRNVIERKGTPWVARQWRIHSQLCYECRSFQFQSENHVRCELGHTTCVVDDYGLHTASGLCKYTETNCEQCEVVTIDQVIPPYPGDDHYAKATALIYEKWVQFVIIRMYVAYSFCIYLARYLQQKKRD